MIAPVPDTLDGLRRQNAGYRTLNRALEHEIAIHRERAREYHAAIKTLDSERAANESLTEEVEALRARLSAVGEGASDG